MKENDTIAAISTPFGNSGIGIVRISGDSAIEKADSIIRSRLGKSLGLISMESHTVKYGYVFENDKIIDEVLCTIFRKPRSFTAEDIVEISCHGGMYILNKVLSCVLSSGIRLADPGEFTKRAFLNGRIDLSQAESVMDLISSENEFSRSNAISQLKGSVKEKVTDLRNIILHETAYIEACLDDPEHYDIDIEYKNRLRSIISNINDDIQSILRESDNVFYLKNGINTVITGKPNAGKSSLLNLLSGFDRAIVTNIPGTTRDIVSESISFGNIKLNITDTAGIRNSFDEVEKIGITKAIDEIKKADLILFVIDSSTEIEEEDRMIAEILRNKLSIVILNKSDKKKIVSEEDIKKLTDSIIIKMSCNEKTGIDILKNTIENLFIKNEIKDNVIYITNKRQSDLLKCAGNSLQSVIDSIDNRMTEDVYTVDLMDAYEYLGEIIGEDISDDLADKIFEEFCMGK